MASYTYPVKHPEGTLTPEQIHALLSRSSIVAKRLAEITKMRFIADYLLSQRFNAQGGGIYYETGEEIFAADAPEAVAPGSAYPKTVMTRGDLAAARTAKWGLDSDVTDEKIGREGVVVLNRALNRLGNSIVKQVDSVAMAVIMAKVTSTFASPSTWTTAGKIAEALLSIQQTRGDLGTGLELDTVVLKPTQWAKLVGILIDDKALPREQGNVVIAGLTPFDALGFTWTTSPFYTGANPMLVDREELGGMADENLGSPGYVRSGDVGIEAKSIRDDDTDKYTVRGRRVVVPVVTEPLAGVTLTNTAL
ncbi:hypothetical protein [Microbacterium sp. NPDC058389]|uniref:phage major capsid protein n=1 Tax=Microbacterium sp. NPDC058389 TaxID=3346475 RepID=UPI00366439D7